MKIIHKSLYRLNIVLLATLFFLPRIGFAGGSPETTLLVVNADSPFSKAIANYYINLRDIPTNHVLYLTGIPIQSTLKIEKFRNKILRPIYQYLVSQELFDHIDTIAYSADFPYAVDFSADAKRAGIKLNKFTGKVGSLTGMTYFFSQVLNKDPSYLMLLSHGYFRQSSTPNRYWHGQTSPKEASILRKAHQLHSKKDYQQAINLLSQLAATKPNHHKIYYLMARSLARMGKLDKALEHLQRSIELGLRNKLATANDRDLKPLADHPRFAELLDTIKPSPVILQPTRGFNSTDSWQYIRESTGFAVKNESSPITKQDRVGTNLVARKSIRPKLMLSTMLAYTGIRGNGLDEIYNYLEHAAQSDGTSPSGSVYLMANQDVRTETRYPAFESLVKDMQRIQRQARITPGTLPSKKNDIIGLVTGSQVIRWSKSRSQLKPGSIAESLTSYGGDFNNPIQTKLTEFLRQGAAGSSGAVSEPYSIWQKFPSPYLHYHYARGSSLAEAFYQSLSSPYQLLIVGDPLARPYAKFTEIAVIEELEKSPLKNVTSITPVAITPSISVKTYELWIDGKYSAAVQPGKKFTINTNMLADGVHELRIVAIEDNSLETRSYRKFFVSINNRNQAINVKDKPDFVNYGNEFVLQGRLDGATSDVDKIRLFHGSKLLATIPVEDGQWYHRLSSTTLGIGTSSIQYHAHRSNFFASSPVVPVIVKPPSAIPSTPLRSKVATGFLVTATDQNGIERTFVNEKLNGRRDKAITADDLKVRYQGKFNVTESSLYQLTILGGGHYRLYIGHPSDKEINKEFKGRLMMPLSLTKGWHNIEIEVLSKVEQVPKAILSTKNGAELMGSPKVRH